MTLGPTLKPPTRSGVRLIHQSRPIELGSCFVLAGGFWVLFFLLGMLAPLLTLSSVMASWIHAAIFAVTTAAISTGLWLSKGFLYRLLTNPRFAVAHLCVLLGSTVAGTFILQGQPASAYSDRFGPVAAGLISFLGLGDLFHTVWFNGFLLLLAVSLICVPIKRRAWRLPGWGFMLSHVGVVLLLLGGLLGNLFGFKGMIDLHEGGSADEAVHIDRKDQRVERNRLGFEVRLEDFEIERYEPEYKLYAYAKDGESYQASRSFSMKDAENWNSVGAGGDRFRVVKTYPDFHRRVEVHEAAAGEGAPVLEIKTGETSNPQTQRLFAGDPKRDVASLPGVGPRVRFVWEHPTDAELAALAETEAAAHTLIDQRDDCCPAQRIAVEPGGTYELASGKHRVTVVSYLPDFVYDMAARKPSTRSQEPNNPAVLVSVKEAGSEKEDQQWLFAKAPNYAHQHGKSGAGPRLVYEFAPPREPLEREFLVVGAGQEIIEFERGKPVRRASLADSGETLTSLGGAQFRVFASAVETRTPETRSDEWKNPVAEVEVREGETVRTVLLSSVHGQPLRLDEGNTILTFEAKADEVKAYRSRLAVLEDGRKVREQIVEVNHPLSHRGVKFYQSNYRKEDPTYSGIQVVKDPGLPLVWMGFSMMSLGVIFCFYVRPRVLKRKKTA